MGQAELILPVGVVESGYPPQNVQVALKGRQRHALKLLVASLKAQNLELANGRRVEDGAKAIQWVLEQYADAAGI